MKALYYNQISELRNKVENVLARSAWEKGVKDYALELIDNLDDYMGYEMQEDEESDHVCLGYDLRFKLLNGGGTWHDYSYGGCSLIYDWQIAERICSPSELKRTKGGERKPNSWETWLDVQARALRQAFVLLSNCANKIAKRI